MQWVLAVGNELPSSALSITSMVFLVLAVGLALSFEFVNGFHDTANAVATVIYTHSLPPWIAVIWSGVCNLAGVLLWGNGAVAFSILALLPVELVLNVGTGAGFAMIFALLTSAILWNIGTWYLGLPASSSHTLIGSILGVGLANAVMSGHTLMEGVNWAQVYKVFLTLLVSPVVGFVGAGVLLFLLKVLIRKPALFQPPTNGAPPPWAIRGTLILTCTGVSFFHGSNDGQKGMGLLLLILIGILPAEYALNLNARGEDLRKLESTSAMIQPMLDARAAASAKDPAAIEKVSEEKPAVSGRVAAAMSAKVLPATVPSPGETTDPGPTAAEAAELSQYLQTDGKLTARTFAAVAAANRDLTMLLQGKASLNDVAPDQRKHIRTDLYLVEQTLAKLTQTGQITGSPITAGEQKTFERYHGLLAAANPVIPLWVKVAVALSLGCGTMIGWKRIVTTVGEKIGKEHLNYAQGMSAEIMAMATIAAADGLGMPVSTTHVLSSGVAGTMAANHSGLQMATLRNILLAWVLTLPVCVLLGAALFAGTLVVLLNNLIWVAAAIVVVIALVLIVWRVRKIADKPRTESMAMAQT